MFFSIYIYTYTLYACNMYNYTIHTYIHTTYTIYTYTIYIQYIHTICINTYSLYTYTTVFSYTIPGLYDLR